MKFEGLGPPPHASTCLRFSGKPPNTLFLHDHVPDILGVCLNEPHLPESLLGQQRGERLGSAPMIQRVTALSVKLGHECDEPLDVFRRCLPHNLKFLRSPASAR